MKDDTKKKLNRRKFIKIVGGSTVCLGAAACLPHVEGDWSSCEDQELVEDLMPASHRVVEVFSADAVIVTETEEGNIEKIIVEEVVVEMFTAGLLALTDQPTLAEAWNVVMPERQAGEKIALKANTLSPYVPTSPELLSAIIGSMTDGPQIPANDIFVWDRRVDELESVNIVPARLGVDCIGTVKSTSDLSGPGYEAEPACLSGRKIYFSKILTQNVDHLINVSVMKNHLASGFTGCLKNHYGSFSQPAKFHEGCENHIAILNTLPEVASVSRLHIMDALIGVCQGNTHEPSDCEPTRLLLSFDPVAIDTRGFEIRDEMRAADGVDPGLPAPYLAKAEELGLGTTEYELVSLTI
jgi:uncharacterized protein (DUF362 family)